ncbi:hypothetical protein [Sphingomonas sp. BE137]|uniref:hypothetical protein n=1 Tax=Sphingomonas sp. BE137 TaxID=2817844 RepID=UPI001AE4FFE6|nr:hypothetical protein [Sphingomonas sp. BE137]MDR6850370.1 hypothetical protein [Sphingomonas sp. BE137]
MLELRIPGGAAVPLFDLPAMLGRQGAAREIGDTIESLIAFMDDLGGDTDLEDDERGAVLMHSSGIDASFDHWRPSAEVPILDEEDGDEEDHNGAEDDFCAHHGDGPGCPIADTGEDSEDDRCAAGDDHMIAGPVVMRAQWEQFGRDSALDHEDAEDGDDTELNGDEYDGSWDPNG